jgi:hypothetical protein
MAHWSALPRSIRLYLESEGIATRRLVYLVVNQRGGITDWGGDVEILPPSYLEVGDRAVDRLVGLVGLLPAGDKPTAVSHLQMAPALIVDVHVFRVPEGDAVVMVDTALEHEPRRQRRQKRIDQKLADRPKKKSAKS